MATCLHPDYVPTVPCPPSEQPADRIRAEYRDLPGLTLTTEQAMRLWTLDRATCQAALEQLIRAGVLDRDDRGQYTVNRCTGAHDRPCSAVRAKTVWGNTRRVRILSR